MRSAQLPPRSRMDSNGHIVHQAALESLPVKNGFLHFDISRSSSKNRRQSCPPKISSVAFSTTHQYVTTVMVRNIPTRFTSISLLAVLEDAGFGGTFSFFYLPMDFRTGKNMGYCFINFLYPDLAQMFANIFQGTRLGLTTSCKVLHVSPSRRQGLKENVALFRGSDMLSSHSLPYLKPFVMGFHGELIPLCHYMFEMIMSLP